jgi:hypothetical protein
MSATRGFIGRLQSSCPGSRQPDAAAAIEVVGTISDGPDDY